MKQIILFLICFAVSFSGCASRNLPSKGIGVGFTIKAQSSGYHPLDPLPIKIICEGELTNKRIMQSLPDETMRIAVGEKNSLGGISYGIAATGYEGNSYVVVLDYIKFNTIPFGVKMLSGGGTEVFNLMLPNYLKDPETLERIVPVYVGVGLRLTASLTVHQGSVDLGNLFALGFAAQAKQISGTLVVQTLGISGENISSIIPMPSDINASTIQNAILSLGSIKAKMYQSDTIITPRVVGIYNNLGGLSGNINNFISSLLKESQLLEIK